MSLVSNLRKALKFINISRNERNKPEIIVISSDEEAANEISYFLTSRKDEAFKHVKFEEVMNLDEKLYSDLEEADAVILLSQKPFDELKELAFVAAVLPEVTFRYIVVLTGEHALTSKSILLKTVRINECKVHAFPIRNQMLVNLPFKLVEVLPQDALSYFVKFSSFEEVVRKKLPFIIALNILKSFILLNYIPFIGLPVAFDTIRNSVELASNLQPAASLEKYTPYAGAAFYLLLDRRKGRKRGFLGRIKFSRISLILLPILLILSFLTKADNEA